MLAPDKVQSEAKKKEKENFKFRTFLKEHADEEESDAQFDSGYQTKHKLCDSLTEDAHLLKYIYEETLNGYTEPIESQILPEGAEQIQMTPGGLYILFESAAWPYRESARIINDQVYLVRE